MTKPQNVMVMRDIACAGYIAGNNTRWFAKNEGAAGYSLETAGRSIMTRLSFDDDVTDKYGSMLAFPACEGQFASGQLDTVMSVTSRVLPWEVTGSSSMHTSFPGGDAMYKQYANKLNLAQVHYGEDMKAAENQDFITQVKRATFEPPTPFSHRCPTDTPRPITRRALPTTPCASWARTASTTRSPKPSCPSRLDRATLAPTPFRCA